MFFQAPVQADQGPPWDFRNNYVKAFSADVASERCCDSRKCVCICSFRCKTFETKRAEMEKQGYRSCKTGSDKERTVEKVQRSCRVKLQIRGGV